MSLQGKTAVVFGGTGGIGIEICKHLLKNGLSKLAILDINELQAGSRAQITSCGINAGLYVERCDITDKRNMEEVIRGKVVPKLGTIDIFVNSAGILDDSDTDRLIAINLTGVINSSLLAMKLMSTETPGGQGGIVVNVSSLAGLEPVPYMAVYGASKHGVIGFTRSLGDDIIFKQTGVKFLTICPGGTDTTLVEKFFEGEDLMFPWMKTDVIELVKHHPLQSPSAVGECLVQAVLDGENGSVWLCMNQKHFKIELPKGKLL